MTYEGVISPLLFMTRRCRHRAKVVAIAIRSAFGSECSPHLENDGSVPVHRARAPSVRSRSRKARMGDGSVAEKGAGFATALKTLT